MIGSMETTTWSRHGRRDRDELDRTSFDVRWAEGMAPLVRRDSPWEVPMSDLPTAHDWSCPVCAVPVPRRPGPGRQRVYCTNACRQRAYRWRRDRLGPEHDPRPVERASTLGRHHAVRRSDDPVSTRRRDGRCVTACGAYARRAADEPAIHGHVRLVPAHDDCGPRRVCARCVELLALDRHDDAPAQEVARACRSEHRRAKERALRRRHRARGWVTRIPGGDPPTSGTADERPPDGRADPLSR